MRKKQKQQLSCIISKAIKKNKCSCHFKPVDRICLKSFKLGCEQCEFTSSRNIDDVLRNPIQAAICFYSSQNQASQICEGVRLVNQHLQVKVGFQAFFANIRSTIIQYCDNILANFQQKWNQAFSSYGNAYNQIKCAEQRYRAVFEQMIQTKFCNGTIQQLEECFSQFCSQSSQDPCSYIQQRVQSILSCEKNTPEINWQEMKQLYQSISDPEIWSPQKFLPYNPRLKKLHSTITLIPEMRNKLSKGGFFLKFSRQNVTLQHEQQNGQILEINKLFEQNDAYYEINKCRLVGVNYSGLTLYRYVCGKIEKIKHFPISGCANVLDFSDCLLLEAEGRILRLWIHDGKKQVVGLSGSNLTMGSKEFQFQYLNSKGETVTRSAFHNQF